ncbi:Ig-like domain repeat protein [Arthrobacter rhizosphaerae]|uniref:Ig-like domain repeat protein n=1 Tax=Arthrobacter rhizosphaerae TaxID=2855490 RepID=UPI001FF1B6FC|nr:Ig-like domain repeat protein [Arthrobacter rhizosphaerae]
MNRGTRTVLACLLAALMGIGAALGGAAWAYWSTTATPGSNGASMSALLNQVATPEASVSGKNVTVSWAASTLSSGAAVDGYVIKRYEAGTLAEQTIGSGCAGTLAVTSCVETGVPAGNWVYTVTPVLAMNWRGSESVKSSPVTVAAPVLALSSTRVKPGTSLTGTASGFLTGETLRFRLDSPTGTELTGTLAGNATPATVPSGGGGAVTVLMPSGTGDGAHTIYAVASPTGDTAAAAVVVDGTAPPAPVLTQTPTNPGGDSATFAFTESETTAMVECRLDAAAFAPCDSPVGYTELASGSHTFQARATDTVGNVSAVTAYTWTVNLSIPTVSIGSPAAGRSYNDAGFTAACGTAATSDVCGSAEDDTAVASVSVSLRQGSSGLYWNGLNFSSGTETWQTSSLLSADWTYAIASASLSEGDYTLRARASDGINLGYDTRTFTIDRTAPAAPTFTTAPPAMSGPAVSIEFTTADPTATFECSLDSGSWSPCVSPKRYDPLIDGSHTVAVRAVDPAGNTSGSTSRTWTADANAPTAAMSFPTTGSYNGAGWTAGCGTAEGGDICGTASDARSGLANVAVSIRRAASNSYWDGTAFAAASETWQTATGTTSWTYPFDSAAFPGDGAYTVRWRATDNAGNTTTGSVTLTVDTTAPSSPVIVQAPQDPAGPSAQFDFTTAETGTVSECRIDSGTWSTCTAPVSYTGLDAGPHTFAVRTTDAGGNTSAPASYSWTVDTGIPSVSISSPSGGRTYTDTGYNTGCGTPAGDICGTASDPQGNLAAVGISIQRASTQLYWDGTSFNSPTEVHLPVTGSTSWSYGMPAGSFPGEDSYTVRARATDGAGLTSLDTITITFDRTPPAAPTITSGPTGTTSSAATFTFTGETDARFECQLDAGTWAACASPTAYEALADGSHTFAVRAIDAAGNTGASTDRTWTVDATAPTIGATFPVADGRYSSTTYDAGCVAGTGDICGTTADSLAGVARVEISIQRASTGLYLSSGTFSSATPAWTTANGTTSWNLPLAATTFPSDGSYTLTVRATDTIGNARTTSTTYVIDRTKPAAAGLTTTNTTSGTVRKLDTGDTFTLTFSEPVSPGSIITGWTGTTTNVVVRGAGNGGSKDRLTVYNATNTTLLPLGTLNLNRTDYITGAVTFGATGTPSTITMNGSSMTITLGTPSHPTRISTPAAAAANASWTPGSTILDLAGNTSATTTYAETDNDNDF